LLDFKHLYKSLLLLESHEQQRWSNVIGYRNYNLALVIIVACVLLTQLEDTSTVRRTTSGDFEQDMMGNRHGYLH
jgi:hypothetical protein